MIICEKEDETLFCDKGVIQITKSIFGRTKNAQKCGMFSFVLRSCNTDVTDIVSDMCNDKPTCTIKARQSMFGNPCKFWTTKYLNITYQCVEELLTTTSEETMTTDQSTVTTETTSESESTTMNPVVSVTKSGVAENNSTTKVLSGTDITGLNSQSEEYALGDATGPVIGFGLGIILITLIVFITLRQKKKRKYINRESNSSYMNKTYDSAIYRPRNNSTKISNSSQGSVKPNKDYENLASASGSASPRPFFKNKTKPPHSKYACAKSSNDVKGAAEVALINDLKQTCAAPKKQQKRLNQYVYTSVKNSNESSSNNVNNEHQMASGDHYDFPKPKTALVPIKKKSQNQKPTSEDYDIPKTKNIHVTNKGNDCKGVKNKNSPFGFGKGDTLKCDSYYLDMSVTDGKAKDIDIKYVTMNRNAKPLDDVSIHLYVNDMNSSSYCNIQIQNKDKNTDEKYENQTGSDVYYDNIPRNKPSPRPVEESVYEPYYVE